MHDDGAGQLGRTTGGTAARRRIALALVLAAAVALTGCGGSAAVSTIGRSSAARIGSDPLRAKQWSLEAVRAREAWRKATGAGVVIAVVDTGVDSTHPDLAGKLVAGRDFVDSGTSPTHMVDPNGHGTHVAGIAAAATGNNIGVSGGAPNAKIMPVRVLGAAGSGSEQTIAAGIDWAVQHGAKVVNLSLGESGIFGLIFKNGALNAAIRRADESGVVVVAAAGNDGIIEQTYGIKVPVIVVNASTAESNVASFSNVGDFRAVAAPGKGILSTAPRGKTHIWPKGTNGYATLDGTSMASPLVAAEAALLVQQGLSPAQIRDRITSTATNPNGNPALGAGIVDFAAAVGADSGSTSNAQRGTSRYGGAGKGGPGSLTVALTQPVPVGGHVNTKVSCVVKGRQYTASGASGSLAGSSLRFRVLAKQYAGPGHYLALATITTTVRGSTDTITVPSPITIATDRSGTAAFSGSGANGTTIAGTVTWRCSR